MMDRASFTFGVVLALLLFVFALGMHAVKQSRVPAEPVKCCCPKCEAKCCEVGK